MRDLEIRLSNQPGELGRLGDALGRAGVSIEGGGVFADGAGALAHFLFADADAARRALSAAGFDVREDRPVVTQRLDQARPGQLGSLTRALGEAGVNIDVMYSDHDNQLILVVNDGVRAKAACDAWSAPPARAAGREHTYAVDAKWTGNTGKGTAGYRDYSRDHLLSSGDKPAIPGSADRVFRGDRARWNPEELLVGALSACHQLTYLHLCADAGIVVTSYEDHAQGVMREGPDGGGSFVRVTLRPVVTLAPGADRARAQALHAIAHEKCFIGTSVRFPVNVVPEM